MEIDLKINANCQLVATPIDALLETIAKPYEVDVEDTVFVEFLIGPDNIANDTIKVSFEPDYYIYDLKSDGLYVYHKLKIFDNVHVDENYQGLCYDSKNNKLLFKGTELKDIVEIIPYLEHADYGILEYVKAPMFSICKLNNCLKELLKKSILECNKKIGNISCDDFDENKKLRDFLFISIHVLENLIIQERYGEAMDILNSIRSCTPICDNISIIKSGCNCK
jgi:hypothetical protein